MPSLIGGLGNQIFIAVAAFCTSLHTGGKVLLPKSTQNSHNHLNLEYRDTVLRYLGEPYNGTAYEYYRENPKTWIYTQTDFEPWSPSAVQTPAILEGYYQFVEPILCHEEEIRDRILLGLETTRASLRTRFSFDFSKTGFLHVRRGDYLEKPTIHFNQPLSYYTKAYASLEIKPQTLLLFSDDPDWVEQQPELSGLPGATVIRLDNEVESLALMSLCESAAICANSTFSWWGAFLGAYTKRAPIVVPKRWISFKTYSLFPPEWKILDS